MKRFHRKCSPTYYDVLLNCGYFFLTSPHPLLLTFLYFLISTILFLTIYFRFIVSSFIFLFSLSLIIHSFIHFFPFSSQKIGIRVTRRGVENRRGGEGRGWQRSPLLYRHVKWRSPIFRVSHSVLYRPANPIML